MGEMAGVRQRPEDVVGQVRVGVDQRAADALLEELDELTGEELALALACEADHVLMRGDAAGAKPERPSQECGSIGSESQDRAPPGGPEAQGPSTESRRAMGRSPNG